jgi:pantoate--beta-alanine ligase
VNVARTIAETRAALAGLPRPLGFVPTMGALHDGHLALVAAARASGATVVASLFVNPSQFGAAEDLGSYPRDEAGDLALFEQAGVSLVFAPAATELYPSGFATTVRVHGLTEHYEGAARPDHFGGVALVVAKLLNIVRPDTAYFGQKDAQQLAVVRRLARDLDLSVEIVAVPTVREPDGLALSSRNAYLTPEERAVAPGLHRALLAGAAAASRPGATGRDAVAAAALLLGPAGSSRPSFSIDYLAAVDADTFAQTDTLGPRTLLIAAARLGKTRLLDNISLSPSAYPGRDATA